MINYKHWLDYTEKLFPLEENQIAFFEDLLKKFNNPAKFLNVECGPAAICKALEKNGVDVTATDSYSGFIQKISGIKNIHSFNLNPFDISRYLGKNFYNVIYTGNYRLIFLQDRALIRKFIFDCKMLLSDGGCLVFDLVNFSKLDFSQPRIDLPVKKNEEFQLYSYILKNAENMKYYLTQQVVANDGTAFVDVDNEQICPISLETFKAFAEELSYSSVEFYSDYKGNPLTENSDRIICVLRK